MTGGLPSLRRRRPIVTVTVFHDGPGLGDDALSVLSVLSVLSAALAEPGQLGGASR